MTPVSSSSSFSGLIRQSFIAGLIALLPLYITLKILSVIFDLVDKPLGTRINSLIQTLAQTQEEIHIPGLGILATLFIVLIIGWLTRHVLFKEILQAFERVIDRVPIVRSLYNASRQIVIPFTEKDVLPFQDVCLVEYPMPGRYTLGMVARHQVSTLADDDRVVVFFPSNHLHLGYPVLLSRHDIHRIDMTIEEAVKFFVSCGVIGSAELFTIQGVPTRLGSRTVSQPPTLPTDNPDLPPISTTSIP